ncbi:hypothetical protein EDB81DRAFT_667473 [Dactylonectria macrodidyma]|uniref:Prolyl 4-hydroxylase alpha subunit Fe(2+) 2OG dioxygenase domain-containing protein n=1 Tax=Dactylonectria macrodidyma TaxID=307937 RepID=A0A9P9IEX8_9HYPO|nr:hypothetical protein EDB81DRAFT_667473 [Dactylonectria macrodidyma]
MRYKTKLRNHLDSIQAAGEIASTDRYDSFVNPGLEILGHLPVPLPLRPDDAETIRNACRQAPFGRGDETVVDTSVRKAWELDHTQFRLCNPGWDKFLNKPLLANAAHRLGLEKARAEPYKMLLYEPGSFFKRHKDSEKTPGMVATLVVCLPSEHQGGEVQLSFGDDERTLETGPASKFDITAMAWYGDVTHEVKELTSGYRLILTYNIILDGPSLTSPSHFIKQSNLLRDMLQEWARDFVEIGKVCYSTDHQYSRTSLSLSLLKGRDAALFQILQRVAVESGFYIFLAHMSHTETDDEDYGEYYDLDSEASTSLSNIFTPDGALVARYGSISTKELLDEHLYMDRAPDSEDEGEFTGNESMPNHLRYHNTVIILTPKMNVASIMGDSSADSILSMVLEDYNRDPDNDLTKTVALKTLRAAMAGSRVTRNNNLVRIIEWAIRLGNDSLYRDATGRGWQQPEVMQAMVKAIKQRCEHPRVLTDAEKADFSEWTSRFGGVLLSATKLDNFLTAVSRFQSALDDVHLEKSFKRWVRGALVQELEARPTWEESELASLRTMILARQNDTDWIVTWFLPTLASRGTQDLLVRFLEWAYTSAPYDVHAIFTRILENATAQLRLRSSDFRTPQPQQSDFLTLLDQSICLGVFSSFLKVVEDSCRSLQAGSWENREEALLAEFLAETATKLQENSIPPSPAMASLFKVLLVKVVDTTSLPPSPVDRGWTYEPRGCGPRCPDCLSLNAFLQSSTQTTARFQMAQTRRRHLQKQLIPAGFFNMVTQKSTPAMTLVVTKKIKMSDHQQELYNAAVAALEARVAPMKGEYMENLLGAEDYRKMILLGNIRREQPAPVPANIVAGPSAGNAAVQQFEAQPSVGYPGLGHPRPVLGPGTSNGPPGMRAPSASAGQKRPSEDETSDGNGREKRVVITID